LNISSKPLLYTPEWVISFEKAAAGELFLAENSGEVIRQYRKRYDMSQEELGELMGLRRESILRIEKGSVTPTLDFVKKFIKAASLIEMIRVNRAQHKEIDVHFLENLAKEFGFDREKLPFIIKMAVESYDKKLMRIKRSLKENKYGK